MSVAVSVDGADAHTHDSFRGLNGAFEQTFKGIEVCREVGLPFQFNMVIRKDTLSQLEDMLHLALDSGANAADPGCCLTPELAKENEKQYERLGSE